MTQIVPPHPGFDHNAECLGCGCWAIDCQCAQPVDESRALDFNPWGFDESEYRVLSNKFVVTRKPHDCSICFDPIEAKTRCRAQSEIHEGHAKTFYFCWPCCVAMAINNHDAGRSLEARFRMGEGKAHR